MTYSRYEIGNTVFCHFFSVIKEIEFEKNKYFLQRKKNAANCPSNNDNIPFILHSFIEGQLFFSTLLTSLDIDLSLEEILKMLEFP